MAAVLVTGGTGSLGSYLVPRLLARGHDVRVLSRRPDAATAEGVEVVQGNVADGTGIGQAVADVSAVIHAATNALRPGARRTEVEGTRNVLGASRRVGAYFLYVSIVGVDRHRFPYYRAKWEAEKLVEASAKDWAIQRATQFHDLLAQVLGGRLMPATRGMSFQLVDAGEVSDRLIELVESRQEGRAPDFGGPEVLDVRRIVSAWREVTGGRAYTVPLPAIGFLSDFDRGLHLCPDHAVGKTTWTQWLRQQHGR